MATRQDAIKALNRLDDDDQSIMKHSRLNLGDSDIAAPEGMIWSGTDLHYMVICVDMLEEQIGAKEYWQYVIDDISGGVEPCPFDDCEICNDDTPDDEKMAPNNQW